MGFIYLRTNTVNGKKYVGQTLDIKTRQRKWKSLTKPYAGTAINNARKKYGVDTFVFEILKECKDEELNKWEMYYIEKLDTKIPKGYNMTDGGDGKSGCYVSEETRKKMSESKKGKYNNSGNVILQINKNTNEIIKEWPSIAEINRQLGYVFSCISNCCKNKQYRHTAYGYIWKYKESVA